MYDWACLLFVNAMTVLTVYFEMTFWGARSGKNQTILLLFSFFLIFIQVCDSRKIHYLTREFEMNELENRYCIHRLAIRAKSVFCVQFNTEFPRQVMNFLYSHREDPSGISVLSGKRLRGSSCQVTHVWSFKALPTWRNNRIHQY